jgi:hypothetical protein
MPQKLDLTPVKEESTKLDLEPVVEDTPVQNQSAMPPASPDFLSSIYHGVTDPLTDAPSRFGRYLSEGMDSLPVMQMRGDNSWHDTLAKFDNQSKGFLQNTAEKTGDLVSGLTSPGNIGMAVLSGGSSILAKAGLPEIAQLASMAGKTLAIPGAIHGGSAVISPNSTLAERGQGLVELAGSMAAMAHSPAKASETPPQEMPHTLEVPKATPNIPADHGIAPIDSDFFSHVGRDRVGSVVEPELPPEFKPVTETGEHYDGGTPVKSKEQLQYELAQNKFNMSREMPDEMRSSSIRPEITPPEGFDAEGVGRRFPGQEANDIGDINQPIDLNNAALEAGSDTARPVNESPVNEGRRQYVSLGNEQAGMSNDAMPPVEPPSTPTLESAPLGQSIVVRQAGFTPNVIKRIKEAGFEYNGKDDNGNFRFKKTSEPTAQPILESEVGEHRPTPAEAKKVSPPIDTRKPSPLRDLYQAPRTIMASGDMSGPLRQGLGLIHKKAFWTSIKPMFEAWRSEDAYNASQQAILDRPMFRERMGPGGKPLPSFAQDAGLKLTDLKDMSTREESFVSEFAEKLPGVRRSGRAYTAFLNNLRADTFESLIKDSKMFGQDAQVNVPLARELANFVNIASGRGSLGSLEQAAVPLGRVLFAPRLIAARLQMMNPAYYIMASPQVRKEALKSLFAIAAVGNTITTLGKMAGGEVSMNPTSPDFGKLKIGNTRLDPYGGFQQYIVAATRLMTGTVTSSTSGNQYDLNNPQGPYDPTHADIATRFIRGKLNPVLGFAWSLMSGKKEMSGEQMNFSTLNPMENAVMQRFTPILAQDLYQLAKDPDMPPGLKAIEGALATFGMGQQTYQPDPNQ